MRDISLNILVHERPHFLELTLKTLGKISEEHRNKIVLNLLVSGQSGHAEQAYNEFKKLGFVGNILSFNRSAPHNFKDKIKWICDQIQKYAIRVDDDCFAGPKTWETLIDSAKYLDEDIMAVAPCVSNGLPSFEWFTETFLEGEAQDELFTRVFQNPILERWGNDYSNLKPAFTTMTRKWNPDLYYQLLYENGDDRLGIHPVRFSLSIQKRINEIILQNWSEFIKPPCIKFITCVPKYRPYYCNTCFMIKTETYKEIMRRQDLDRDAFEEIPFNLYRREKGLQLMFLTDAWMMNMYFRSVGNLQVENELFQKIREKLQ